MTGSIIPGQSTAATRRPTGARCPRSTELPNVVNPPNGWVDNNNNAPWSAAGAFSPDPKDYPKYMDMFGENFRGIHALALLSRSRGWNLDKFQAAAFDSFQPGFAVLIPSLLKAYNALPVNDARTTRLSAPIAVLRGWNYRWSGESVAQTLAMFWGDAMQKALDAPADEPGNKRMMRSARHQPGAEGAGARRCGRSADARVRALAGAVGRGQPLPADFARDRPAVQRQRAEHPGPFAGSAYGSLASFGSSPKPGTVNGTEPRQQLRRGS